MTAKIEATTTSCQKCLLLPWKSLFIYLIIVVQYSVYFFSSNYLVIIIDFLLLAIIIFTQKQNVAAQRNNFLLAVSCLLQVISSIFKLIDGVISQYSNIINSDFECHAGAPPWNAIILFIYFSLFPFLKIILNWCSNICLYCSSQTADWKILTDFIFFSRRYRRQIGIR